MNDAVHADTAPLRRCCRFACVVAALAAGALIAAVPHRARAHDAQDAQASAAEARCRAAVQNAPQPPLGHSPLLVRVLQPSVEPVPATDGLIHLAYMAQVTNHSTLSIGLVKARGADPTATPPTPRPEPTSNWTTRVKTSPARYCRSSIMTSCRSSTRACRPRAGGGWCST